VISDIDVRRTYCDDQRHPYYSLQAGRSFNEKRGREISSMSNPVRAHRSHPKWIWGHFQAALKRALMA
jgi:hypothetical protein